MVRRKSLRGRLERGFTLIELMVVVVIIAILAAVVVPSFIGESKKVKASTEITPMFAEISAKEEREKNENGAYAALAKCPAAPAQAGQAASGCAATWTPLGILSPSTNIYCTYEVLVGDSATPPTGLVFDPVGAAFAPPAGCCATGWYVVHAACDMDGDGTLQHWVAASFDGTPQKTNEGE